MRYARAAASATGVACSGTEVSLAGNVRRVSGSADRRISCDDEEVGPLPGGESADDTHHREADSLPIWLSQANDQDAIVGTGSVRCKTLVCGHKYPRLGRRHGPRQLES